MSIYDAYVAPTQPAAQPVTVQPQVQPVMNSAQASSILNNYGIDPSQTLSASNIQNTLTRPTAAPDDLLGIRSQINYDLGLDTETKKLNEIKANYYKAPSVISGQQVNMGVIRGETGLVQERLLAEIQAQQDRVSSLSQERDFRMGVAEKNIDFTRSLKLQYPGAKIGFGDSLDSIEKKLVKFQKDQEESTYKKELQRQLMSMGISTKSKKGGTLDIKGLEKKLKESNKEAAKEAKEASKRKAESDDISLALQKLQLQKASQETKTYDYSNIASLFDTGTQSIQPSANSSYWDYLK